MNIALLLIRNHAFTTNLQPHKLQLCKNTRKYILMAELITPLYLMNPLIQECNMYFRLKLYFPAWKLSDIKINIFTFHSYITIYITIKFQLHSSPSTMSVCACVTTVAHCAHFLLWITINKVNRLNEWVMWPRINKIHFVVPRSSFCFQSILLVSWNSTYEHTTCIHTLHKDKWMWKKV